MHEIWKAVFSLSLSGTVVILTLFVLCRVFRKTLSRSWQYYIWLVAVFRLLIPFSGELNLVGTVLTELETAVDQGDLSLSGPVGAAEEMAERQIAEGSDTVPEDSPDASRTGRIRQEEPAVREWDSILVEHLSMIWLAGAVFLLLRRVMAYQSFAAYLRLGSRPAKLEQMERFGQILEAEKVRGNVELYVNASVSSPLLIGCFRPRVILPEKPLPETDLYYTALHELTHCRRYDLFYKWLLQVTICLHWFNPFVWLMGREVNRACELACDEAVLDRLEAEEKRAYGDTLLRAAESGGSWKSGFGVLTMHESGRLLKGRLEAILAHTGRPWWVKVISLTLAVQLGCSAAALGVYAGPKKAGVPFTSGGNDFLLSNHTNVIEQDHIFYILCDGVTEEEIPLAGVVDGIGIMVVHKDRSLFLTLPDDTEDLEEEAENVCAEMLEKGRMTEQDARLVIETAGELQERADASEEDDRPFDDYFIQNMYYRDGYLFQIGYELREEKVGDYAGTALTLENGEQLYVSFADTDQNWMEDTVFLDALGSLISEFRQRTGNRVSNIKHPFVSGVEYVGTDVERLTAEYYEAEECGRYSALLPELNADLQRDYLERAANGSDSAFFSITLGSLYRGGSLTEKQINDYMFKAYEDGNTAFFAILTGYMSEEQKQEWYTRLLEEEGGKSSYTAILRGELEDVEEKEEDWEDWDFDWDW